ncbi:MAG: amidohydrolase family protein [Candidatus Aenigmarchaeota archaeon]|nr:amidohydrolase family protein [Candidatus Aenigmarchaeota archaeon]
MGSIVGDAHMHLFGLNEKIFGEKRDDSLKKYTNYFKDYDVKTAFIVYNNESRLNDLKNECKKQEIDVDIRGFYWIKDINNYEIPKNADAIKFESYIDDIDICDIQKILDSDELNLPVYIHCGELKSELSNPLKVEQLAKMYPERKFIIGHSGTYGPPIDKKYFTGLSVIENIKDAIRVASELENVYLETSILNCDVKLDLIVKNRDKLKYKLLLGSDFPLTIGDILEGRISISEELETLQPTIKSQEELLLNAGVPVETINQFYRNIKTFFD